jgi:hypothetical protein
LHLVRSGSPVIFDGNNDLSKGGHREKRLRVRSSNV